MLWEHATKLKHPTLTHNPPNLWVLLHFWYHWKILDKLVARLFFQNAQINEAKVIEFKMIFVFENLFLKIIISNK
jgi:hypothetical protein